MSENKRPGTQQCRDRAPGLATSFGYRAVALLSLVSVLPLAVRTNRRCLCLGTVKRVKRAWLRNAVAMTHCRRIVNARSSQQWHGHDRYDERHLTPLHSWGETPPRQSITRLRAYSRFPLKMVEVLLVEHVPVTTRQHDRSLNGLTAKGARHPLHRRDGCRA